MALILMHFITPTLHTAFDKTFSWLKAAALSTFDVVEEFSECGHCGIIQEVAGVFCCHPFCRIIVTDLQGAKKYKEKKNAKMPRLLIFFFSTYHIQCFFVSPRISRLHKRARTAGTPQSQCRKIHCQSLCAEQRKSESPQRESKPLNAVRSCTPVKVAKRHTHVAASKFLTQLWLQQWAAAQRQRAPTAASWGTDQRVWGLVIFLQP